MQRDARAELTALTAASHAQVATQDALAAVKAAMLDAIKQDGSILLDGWTSARGRKAAAEMEEAGVVVIEENVGDQYTFLRVTLASPPTP